MISKLPINGIGRLFLFKSLFRYSTNAAAVVQPLHTHFLQDYLINSLGFSNEEALSTTKKVHHRKSSRNHPDIVVNFLRNLGLNKTHIKDIVSADPRLLSCNVQKTLLPRIRPLQEIGISGLDLVKILINYKSILARGQLGGPVEYLRNLLGSDEKAAKAIKKRHRLLAVKAPNIIASHVELLQKYGFSGKNVCDIILYHPGSFLQTPELLEEAMQRVENDFKISRESKMFYRGVKVVFPLRKSTVDRKLGILRSFGWSNATIYSMVGRFPPILAMSEEKIRKVWNFIVKELGYTPNYLITHPVLFSLNLEKRVKLRSEVLKILNEKKLNKRKAGLYHVLCIAESKFVNDYLLPYKNEIPDVFDSYFKIVGGREKVEKL